MIHFTRFLITGLLIVITGAVYSQTINTKPFHKVIISPYIEATFIQGDQERVVIEHSAVDPGKLHVESKNGTLRLYLDGAKVVPRDPRDKNKRDQPLYPVHAVTATIYYKKLDALSLRGEEGFTFPGALSADQFTLKLYGESSVTFAEARINELHTTLYGESSVKIQSGNVNYQAYTSYGEGKVNTMDISSEEAKLTAYGEADFNLNVSDRIKITSFGEAKLRYKGNAHVVKGLNVGGVDVARLD